MTIKRLDHVNFVTHDKVATVRFYCEVIGLVCGENLTIDTAKSLYFYIKGQQHAVLHVGDAKAQKDQPKFQRFAELSEKQEGKFSTGAFDHFCLLFDFADYDSMVAKLDSNNIDYKTYCHQDIALKQIWVLDPNGVRVELNFVP
jgi:catechol 2,3-dioxygenase-like lactoylglutathione lyase family enzyme